MSGGLFTDSNPLVAFEASPGMSEYAKRWLEADESLPAPASLRLYAEAPRSRSGSAFQDAAFSAELRNRHHALKASEASLANVGALAKGAPCVITGQQPSLLGGPLYCAWKLAGAVGLAASLSRELGREVVPVYWCGADDSDFEEARRAWLWNSESGAVRAELAKALARPGEMVGSISGAEIETVERNALRAMGANSHGELVKWFETMEPSWDLGERSQALYLKLFAQAGLVVVDARSGRLRELGRELMTRYAQVRAEVASAVEKRGEALRRAGLSVALHPAAIHSGLFRVREGRREKLEPQEILPACEANDDLSPAVLLRPVLQDALLAPIAAVLGPSELHYHAQLAPVYEILAVEAASPALRPQLTFLPPDLAWPASMARQRALLQGGDTARQVLGVLSIPHDWEEARHKLSDSIEAALREFEATLGEVAEQSKISRTLQKLREAGERIEETLAAQSLKTRSEKDRSLLLVPDLLGLRGAPQERTYSAVVAWEWFGSSFVDHLKELAGRYALDLKEGRAPIYRARMPREKT